MVVNPAYPAAGFILCLMLIFSGCVADAEMRPADPVITETTAPVIIANESQPLVMVEINQASAEDAETEFMYRTKGRYLGESFQVSRDNVSGQKDLNLDISVYNSKFLRVYHESGADNWGTHKWWTHIAPEGQKFLFVFLRVEMEGTGPSSDPRIWGFESSHFAAQIQNQFAPIDESHSQCVAIKEMENVYTFNDDYRISDYGKTRVIDMYKVRSDEETCQDLGWLRMGQSNQWDGYLIWIVPESVTEKDIQIVGDFDHFGSAWWKLTRRPA